MSVTPLPTTLPTPPSPLPLGPEFEIKAAALSLRDDRFARESLLFLRPDHFTNALDRNLVLLCQEFVERYRSVPTPETFVKQIQADKRINTAEHPLYIKRIIDLYKIDLKEREYIREKIVEFCQRQELLLLAASVPDLLSKKDGIERIRGHFSKAMQIGEASANQFTSFFDTVEIRKQRRENTAAGAVIRGVSTGFEEIDKHLYRRGWGRGELSVVMAPSKRGKTALMIQSALTSCVMSKSNILYISLEVDEEIISDRGDALLTGTSMGDLLAQRDALAAKITAMGSAVGKFWIERRPANSMTTDQVEACIEAYLNAGHRLDLVVVDYIGILRLKPSDDRFVGLGNAAKELRRLAGQYNIAMLTGAQTNRDAVGKQVAGMDSIGESFAIVQDCDLLLSINANEAEMRTGVRRLFLAAARNTPEATFKVQGDLDKMQLVQRVLEVTV